MNSRLTPKDRSNIMSAVRRAFVRSTLRASVINLLPPIHYIDPKRPRVKQWRLCPLCKVLTPKYLFEVDHIEPVIPIGVCTVDMNWDDIVNRIFAELSNMQAICKVCHKEKTARERKQRHAKKHDKSV